MVAPGGFSKFIATTGDICLDRTRVPQVGPATFEKLAAGCARMQIEMLPSWKADRPAPTRIPPRELWVLGMHVKLLLTAEETNGRFSVAELSPDPGVFVPNHRHLAEDEMFYVTDGTVWFEVGGESITATAGTFVYIPRGTMHGFRNIGSRRARMLNVHTPGGFDKFFEASGTPCEDIDAGPPNVAPNFAKFAIICRDHENHHIGGAGAAGAHRGKGGVTRGIEESNEPAGRRHMISTDMLRDAARFTGRNTGFTDVIKQ
jgi:quercetin dioxygenase-like cupin family protein